MSKTHSLAAVISGLTFLLMATVALGEDCNNNGIEDSLDIAAGTSKDFNGNNTPDECEDCDGNMVPDFIDILLGDYEDCDGDGVPDTLINDCELDTDSDGAFDDCDGCPNDPFKQAPGGCGCGIPDSDADNDGELDCNDGCPHDPLKIRPGQCGCRVPDTDSDFDGVADCKDICPDEDDIIDSDRDGVPDCADECPEDPDKSVEGVCGCGVRDIDRDEDSVLDCMDNCPSSRNKDQNDFDFDGLGDACDGCPQDPQKTAPGPCGCGTMEVDEDADDAPDCIDTCPGLFDPDQVDFDEDGRGDACDDCPEDPRKRAPGLCGCGVADVDYDIDGVIDCDDRCLNTPIGAVVDDEGCTVTSRERETAGPNEADVSTDSADANTSGASTDDGLDAEAGQNLPTDAGVNGCGAIGMVSLIALFAGFAAANGRTRSTKRPFFPSP